MAKVTDADLNDLQRLCQRLDVALSDRHPGLHTWWMLTGKIMRDLQIVLEDLQGPLKGDGKP